MEIIKRKILLESYIDRTSGSVDYGKLTAVNFYLKIQLNQKIDDMGIMSDIPFIPSSTSLVVSDFYDYGRTVISGVTDTKLTDVRSYSNTNPYQVGFNTNSEVYQNFSGQTINGVDKVIEFGDKIRYALSVDKNDSSMGTKNQKNGISYQDITGTTLTNINYKGEGWNATNTSFSALTKEEYLFGIISPPEVKNDVFIERGETPVMEIHLRFSEIRNLEQLERYGNGFYSLKKQ